MFRGVSERERERERERVREVVSGYEVKDLTLPLSGSVNIAEFLDLV